MVDAASTSTQAPTFSVVIPAYNATSTIHPTISSVLSQTFRDFELIVVDDGSTDGTAECVELSAKGDPRVRLIRQENQGTAGAARNAGIECARGTLISFLDSDDLWLPGFLGEVEKVLRRHRSAGLAYSDVWILDEATGRIRRKSALKRHPASIPSNLSGRELLLTLLESNFIPACTATVRGDILRQVGVFDREVVGCDDLELWLRIAIAGYGAVRVPRRLAIYRDREDSQSKNRLMMNENLRYVLAQACVALPDQDRAKAIVRDRLNVLERRRQALEKGQLSNSPGFAGRHFIGGLKRWLMRPIDFYFGLPGEIRGALSKGESPG